MTQLPTHGRITAGPVVMPRNVASWRPWRALTQAEFNEIQAEGAWDPDVLYVVTPQRVMLGGHETWPGPWDGGVVHVTSGTANAANFNQVIPTTTEGNLVIAITATAGTHHAGAITGVSDDAGQTWAYATGGASAPDITGINCWYRADSAPISQVNWASTAAVVRAWWVIEIAGAGALDSVSPIGSGNPSGYPDVIHTVVHRSLVFAAVHRSQPSAATSRPGPPCPARPGVCSAAEQSRARTPQP